VQQWWNQDGTRDTLQKKNINGLMGEEGVGWGGGDFGEGLLVGIVKL
jgi:hypothetical protein